MEFGRKKAELLWRYTLIKYCVTLYLKPLKENDKLIQISKCPQNENNTLIPQKNNQDFQNW